MVSVRLAVAGENEAIMAKIDLVMTRMDTLFNILDFRANNAGSGGAYCEQPPLQGEQIGDNSGDVANQQPTLGEDCSYVTPPTPIHKGVSYVKNGDEFENHGRQLRRKKRSQALLSPYLEWPKRARFTRSKRHTFEPFRQPYEKDKQAFWKWFNSDTKNRSTIRCGLAMQNRHFFEIMLHNSAFLNSETLCALYEDTVKDFNVTD
ncbi:uncharacterized protein LOC21410946 [Morus notabilis]|uniref:uncharacterized protein LOC21410946 n=1 Tax=Morus notabilis TaxID=981085 RepID=UPI000CED6AF9|nr:uncharacterized protein LOC21410946 [Morus notabilis]XP_024018523.1 uncharacterized protein LOC21410946 [Morus notabilis]